MNRRTLTTTALLCLAVGTVAAVSLQATISTASAAEVTPTIIPRAPVSTTDWIGIAASSNKRVFRITNQSTADASRNEAKTECENTSGRDCDAIAVPSSWDIFAINCTGPGKPPNSFVAGSLQDQEMQIAYSRASRAGYDPSNCIKIYSE